MAENSDVIAALERLREEAFQLRDKAPLDNDFRRWHKQVLDILRKLCGPHAPEVKEIENIRFKHGATSQFTRRILKRCREWIGDGIPVESVEDNIYRQTLADAADTILSVIKSLKCKEYEG